MTDSKTESKIIFSETPPDEWHISILPSEWDKIRLWTSLAVGEVGGLGLVNEIKQDGKVTSLQVYKALLLKQTTSAAETLLSQDDILGVMDSLSDEECGNLKLWWHSHANMGVFWSGQDEKCIRENHNDYTLSIVVNKRSDVLGRVDIFTPYHAILNGIAIHIPLIPEMEEIVKQKAIEEAVKKCRDKEFITSTLKSCEAFTTIDKVALQAEFDEKVPTPVISTAPGYHKWDGRNYLGDNQWRGNVGEGNFFRSEGGIYVPEEDNFIGYGETSEKQTPVVDQEKLEVLSNEQLLGLLDEDVEWGKINTTFPTRPKCIPNDLRDHFRKELSKLHKKGEIEENLLKAELDFIASTTKITRDSTTYKAMRKQAEKWWETLWCTNNNPCEPICVDEYCYEEALVAMKILMKRNQFDEGDWANFVYAKAFIFLFQEDIEEQGIETVVENKAVDNPIDIKADDTVKVIDQRHKRFGDTGSVFAINEYTKEGEKALGILGYYVKFSNDPHTTEFFTINQIKKVQKTIETNKEVNLVPNGQEELIRVEDSSHRKFNCIGAVTAVSSQEGKITGYYVKFKDEPSSIWIPSNIAKDVSNESINPSVHML